MKKHTRFSIQILLCVGVCLALLCGCEDSVSTGAPFYTEGSTAPTVILREEEPSEPTESLEPPEEEEPETPEPPRRALSEITSRYSKRLIGSPNNTGRWACR